MKATTSSNNSMTDWETFLTPSAKELRYGPPEERWCRVCAEFWTSRTGVQGFNRCPHCHCLHTHEDAEDAIRLARRERAEQVERARVSAAIEEARRRERAAAAAIMSATKVALPMKPEESMAAWDRFAASGAE
jgi:hypothetical protein